MSTYLDRLHDEYRRAAEAGKSVMDRAADENRELTPEEAEQRDKAFADVERLHGEIEKVQRFEKLREAADAFRADMAPRIEAPTLREPTDREMLVEVFKRARDHFDSHLSPAFADIRALQTEGGSAIPETFYDLVTVYERTGTPMFDPAVVTVLNTRGGEPITLPRLTADVTVGGTVTAEAAGITEADPTLSSVVLGAYKYAAITLWSAEMDTDNVIGLEDLVARSAARELVLDIGTALTTGDGSGDPNGFITAATNGGTASGTANNAFFGPDDIVDLFYGRAEPYRRVGVWQASSTGLAKVRKLKDANGQYIWQPSLVPGAPETILGRPVYENPAMAAVASASKSIAFGDFSRYFVRRVTPMRVELSRDYKFSTDQLALKTVERVDGDLVDTIAIAYLVSANA